MSMRPEGIIERPKTYYESMKVDDEGTIRTYHNINGMWGEQLWHERDWAIYRPINDRQQPTTSYGFCCVLVHSRIWTERRTVLNDKFDSRQWLLQEDEAAEIPEVGIEEIELVCHTQIYPIHDTFCPTCRQQIPDGAVALWKLMNIETLSEEA